MWFGLVLTNPLGDLAAVRSTSRHLTHLGSPKVMIGTSLTGVAIVDMVLGDFDSVKAAPIAPPGWFAAKTFGVSKPEDV